MRETVSAVAQTNIFCAIVIVKEISMTEDIEKKTNSNQRLLESPLVAGVLRRRRPGDEVAINKQKFKRPFMNEDGEWISD